MGRFGSFRASRVFLAGFTGALVLALFAAPALAGAIWVSGARNNDDTQPFASWRGTRLGVISGWIDWRQGWGGMETYAAGPMPRVLRAKSANVSFGHGLFPQGGSISVCACGSFDEPQRRVARLLAANGVGDAEIRLGWEASGNWFPWSAVDVPPEQWKACFTRIARAMKSVAPQLRIGWFMAKKGRLDVRAIYPADAPITNIGISHYDDASDRFGNETYLGGPWGPRAWLAFARAKGKRLALGEWGVGRAGDNPAYIRDMYDFLREAGPMIAHEAYFNTGTYRLFPVTTNPRSSALYRELF